LGHTTLEIDRIELGRRGRFRMSIQMGVSRLMGPSREDERRFGGCSSNDCRSYGDATPRRQSKFGRPVHSVLLAAALCLPRRRHTRLVWLAQKPMQESENLYCEDRMKAKIIIIGKSDLSRKMRVRVLCFPNILFRFLAIDLDIKHS
jgi:hypothetical protein